MKKLATLEQWARRLATREQLEANNKAMLTARQRERRLILAICEAYQQGYHDRAKEEIDDARKTD